MRHVILSFLICLLMGISPSLVANPLSDCASASADDGLILISSIIKSEPSFCGAGDGSIKVNAFGNPGPFQYSINGGANYYSNGGFFTGLEAGTYQIRVRGNNGCCMVSAFPQSLACSVANSDPVISVQGVQDGWSSTDSEFWTCAGQTVSIAVKITDADQDNLTLGSPDPIVQEMIGADNFQILNVGNQLSSGLMDLIVQITPPVDFFGELPFSLSVTDDQGNNPEFTVADFTLSVANLMASSPVGKACAGVAQSFQLDSEKFPADAVVSWSVLSEHSVDFQEDNNSTYAQTDESSEVGDMLRMEASITVGDENYSCVIRKSIDIQMGAYELDVSIESFEESICGDNTIGFSAEVNGYEANTEQSEFSWTSTGNSFSANEASYSSSFVGNNTETVTVTAQFGACSGSSTKEIAVECPDLEVSWLSYNASCEENNGNIVLSIQGGLEPYLIDWGIPGLVDTDLTGLFPGQYQVSVEDAIGNEVISTIEVNVDDDEVAPSLSCPENLTTISLDGNCEAPMPDLRLMLDVTDNCIGEITITQFPAPGDFLALGTVEQVVKFKAVDASGNVSVCQITLAVEDKTAPNVICGVEKVLAINDECQVSVPDFRTLTNYSDNCDNNVLVEQFPAPGTVISNNFDDLFVEVSVSDVYGNYSTCVYQLLVEDHVAPVIMACQPSISKVNDDGKCGAHIEFEGPEVFDCTDVTIEQVSGLPSGDLFPVGLTEVLFKVSDEFGNSSFCGFSVQVGDFEAPQILIENSPTLFLDETGKVIVNTDVLGATAQDNCTLDKFEANPSVFYCSDLGMQNVRLSAVDQFGNLTEVDIEVEVKDNIAPQIFCSQEIIEISILQAENLSVNDLNIQANDNCNLLGTSITSGPLVVEAGLVQSVTIQSIDQSGNQTLCQVSVKIQEACDDEINVISTNGSGLDPIFDTTCPGFQESEWVIEVVGLTGTTIYQDDFQLKAVGNLRQVITNQPSGMYFYQIRESGKGARILKKGRIQIIN